MMKKTGIWIDFKKANIFHLEDDKIIKQTVNSKIESRNLKGGSRSKQPWGPMDKTSERKLLERKKHQRRNYYQSICNELKNSNEVFVMGPAEAKIGLKNFIEKDEILKNNVLGILTTGFLTINQQVEKVKSFFETYQ